MKTEWETLMTERIDRKMLEVREGLKTDFLGLGEALRRELRPQDVTAEELGAYARVASAAACYLYEQNDRDVHEQELREALDDLKVIRAKRGEKDRV